MTRYAPPSWFYAISLALIIFACSQAGYYDGKAFADFSTLGYSTSTEAISNTLTPIGTAGSVAAVLVVLSRITAPMGRTLLWFLGFQLFIAITALWSTVLTPTWFGIFKAVIYVVALSVISLRLSEAAIVKTVAYTALIICLVGDYLALTNAAFATSLGAAGWRGLFIHKNGFAAFCLFSFVIVLPGIYVRPTRAVAFLTCVVLLATLVATQGKSALIAAVLYAGLVVPLMALKRFGISGPAIIRALTLAMLAVLLLGVPALILLILNGSITLTGRVQIWAEFFEELTPRFIYGFGGNTTALNPSALDDRFSSAGTAAIDSSIIATTLNLGVIGLLAYLCFLARCWSYTIKQSRQARTIFCAASIVAFLLIACVESTAQITATFPTAMLLLQFFMLERLVGRDTRKNDMALSASTTHLR
jgi:hypothetical protein